MSGDQQKVAGAAKGESRRRTCFGAIYMWVVGAALEVQDTFTTLLAKNMLVIGLVATIAAPIIVGLVLSAENLASKNASITATVMVSLFIPACAVMLGCYTFMRYTHQAPEWLINLTFWAMLVVHASTALIPSLLPTACFMAVGVALAAAGGSHRWVQFVLVTVFAITALYNEIAQRDPELGVPTVPADPAPRFDQVADAPIVLLNAVLFLMTFGAVYGIEGAWAYLNLRRQAAEETSVAIASALIDQRIADANEACVAYKARRSTWPGLADVLQKVISAHQRLLVYVPLYLRGNRVDVPPPATVLPSPQRPEDATSSPISYPSTGTGTHRSQASREIMLSASPPVTVDLPVRELVLGIFGYSLPANLQQSSAAADVFVDALHQLALRTGGSVLSMAGDVVQVCWNGMGADHECPEDAACALAWGLRQAMVPADERRNPLFGSLVRAPGQCTVGGGNHCLVVLTIGDNTPEMLGQYKYAADNWTLTVHEAVASRVSSHVHMAPIGHIPNVTGTVRELISVDQDPTASVFVRGERIWGKCASAANHVEWSSGIVTAVNADGTYAVGYDDGEFEPKQPASQLRLNSGVDPNTISRLNSVRSQR